MNESATLQESTSQISDYRCPICDAPAPWRPESAGRPTHCACGAALTIPFAPGLAEQRTPTSPHPLSPPDPQTAAADGDSTDPTWVICPDCGASMELGAALCGQCGFHQPKPKRRIFRRPPADNQKQRLKPAADHWVELTIRPVRDQLLPAAMSIVGLMIEIGLLATLFTGPHHWAKALAVAPLTILLAGGSVALAFIVAMLLTPFMELALGPIRPLGIKLSAAVVVPAAAGALMWSICGRGVSGFVLGWMAGMILSLSLFRLLFEFDWPDSMFLIALVSLSQTVTLLLVLWPLTHGPMPLGEMWRLFGPIAGQSALTFLLAGGLVAPHVGRA